MSMINTKDILETIKMIEEEHLDIRTITMGISLRDLASDDINVLADKVYDKITRRAEKLVSTGEQIERELGIPIINKRISVTPIAMIGAVTNANSYVPLAKALDRAASATGVNFVGGFSALVQKGFAKGDEILINSIPEALAETNLVCSSVNVASTKAGVNLDAVGLMGRIIKQTAELTKDNDSMGCSKLVVFANAVDDNPFMAGAFHGIGEPETVINVGVSGPGVVQSAIRRAGDCPINEVAEVIKKTAFKITRMGQLVGAIASQRLGVPFGIVDLSLAPTPAIGAYVSPDIVVVDLLMPIMDGINFVRKAKEQYPDISYVMLSQVSSKEMISQAYECGVTFFIQKPVNGMEVVRVLTNVIDSIQMRRTFNQMQSLFLKDTPPNAAAAPIPEIRLASEQPAEEKPHIKRLRSILQKLGIIGESGSADIITLVDYMIEQGPESGKFTVSELCSKFSPNNSKSMEQRIRRTVNAGLTNLANMGIEDYSNDTFHDFAGSIYSFEQIRKEMDYIRGKSDSHGKVSLKNFLNSLIFYCTN